MLGILDYVTGARTLVSRRQIEAFQIGFKVSTPRKRGGRKKSGENGRKEKGEKTEETRGEDRRDGERKGLSPELE
ncbi:hypothetical protein TNCV_2543281 [Trichonephila clavipes]|nr:hypothetical protein TNCV_2543281 [Trichonephila clavipes]